MLCGADTPVREAQVGAQKRGANLGHLHLAFCGGRSPSAAGEHP